MKLTPELIDHAPSVINPEKQLTLQLRNQQIPFIENLDYMSNEYAVLDLTNNEITDFSGIPERLNLQGLLLARNHITTINQASCHLTSLLMMHNEITSFRELSKLRTLEELSTLIMLGNPIAREHHYRLFTIWLLPKLAVLDCQKVKLLERAAAQDLLGQDYDNRSPAADALLGSKPQVKSPSAKVASSKSLKMLTAEEKAKLVAELEQALSMKEIERISRLLKQGSAEAA